MKHLRPINQKAARIEAHVAREARARGGAPHEAAAYEDAAHEGARTGTEEGDVVGLQSAPPGGEGPHYPLGCSLVFQPGWEVDSRGGTAGLCQPVERDIFDCHISCFWPAHVPDQLNHAPDWTGRCASAQKDWRTLDVVFP